jgi:hypothetical protein
MPTAADECVLLRALPNRHCRLAQSRDLFEQPVGFREGSHSGFAAYFL